MVPTRYLKKVDIIFDPSVFCPGIPPTAQLTSLQGRVNATIGLLYVISHRRYLWP